MNNVDPKTATPEELAKIHAGSYVQWLVKNYLKPETERTSDEPGYEQELKSARNLFLEDLSKVSDDLKKFDRFKSKIKGEKDINKLTPQQLYNAVKEFSLEIATMTKAESEEIWQIVNYITNLGLKITAQSVKQQGSQKNLEIVISIPLLS